jgi:hypothetical protein
MEAVEVPMNARRLWSVAGGLAVLAGLVLAAPAARAQEKDKPDDKIPKAVMDALKSKFPKPEITKWTKETEGGKVIYDIEFKQDGRKCEADIQEDGTFVNIEREIAAKDLPEAVAKAVATKYPGSTLKEIMEIKVPKGTEEKLDGYEVVLETADKKSVELTVAPDGKILEDSGAPKKEDKK